MLDLLAVARQLAQMRGDLLGLGEDLRGRLEEGLGAWGRAAALGPRLAGRLRAARTSWLVAEPLEPLRAVAVRPVRAYRVGAVDGSQVFPDRHELPHCYLVNVGTVDIDYTTATARLASAPTLVYRPEELYPLVGGVRQEADGRVVAARRFAAECDALAAWVEEATGPAPGRGGGRPPTLALLDGTLLLWWLEPDPERLAALAPQDVKARTFASLGRLLATARARGALVAGYLSGPRSTDVVAMLKVVLCTEDPVDCDRCPYAAGAKTWAPRREPVGPLGAPTRPCEEAEALTDAELFGSLLAPGQRSPRFRSAAKVAGAYEAPVDFVYLHTGAEVARVEFPAWVDGEGLEVLAGALVDQCDKGLGYPVALAEAHEQAVVRWADRQAFLDLVRRAEGGVSRVTAKLTRKRASVL